MKKAVVMAVVVCGAMLALADTLPSVKNKSFFIQNSGQYDSQVQYVVRGSKGTVFLTPKEVVFDFVRTKVSQSPDGGKCNDSGDGSEMERLVFRMRFDAGNPDVMVVGQKELPGKINYFTGSRAAWKSGISTFEEVLYRNLYDGIDLRFTLPRNNLRYVIHLHKDTDPGKFRLTYEGIKGLNVNDKGDLVIHTAFGDFTELPPQVWQGDKALNVRFRVIGTNQVGVDLLNPLTAPGQSEESI